jgi:hypothetical protein
VSGAAWDEELTPEEIAQSDAIADETITGPPPGTTTDLTDPELTGDHRPTGDRSFTEGSRSPVGLRSPVGSLVGGAELLDALADRDRCGPALRAYDAHPPFARAFMVSVGIAAVLTDTGTDNFVCILPGHHPEPRANLWRDRRGLFIYRDHHHDTSVWVPERKVLEPVASFAIADVFAAVVSGHCGRRRWDSAAKAYRLERRRGQELAVWKVRLLAETGFLDLPPVDLPPLASDAPPSVRAVYDGAKRLVAIQRLLHPHEKAVPLAKRFLADWCGISESAAQQAKRTLVESVFEKAETPPGRSGRTTYWRPRAITL